MFGPHLQVADELVIETLYGNTGKNLLLSFPFRWGKSVYLSQWLPAWYLGVRPEDAVILACNRHRNARQFSKVARNILRFNGPNYFNVEVDRQSSAGDQWSTINGGICQAFGVGSGMQGATGDLIIVDDLYGKAEDVKSELYQAKLEDWWNMDVMSRLTPNGRVILCSSRLPQDLIGKLLIAEPDNWHVLQFSALDERGQSRWPEKWPTDKLLAIKRRLLANDKEWIWKSAYELDPPGSFESEFDPACVQGDDIYWVGNGAGPEGWHPEHLLAGQRIISVDTSKGTNSRGDFSAITLLAEGADRNYHVDMKVQRIDIERLSDLAVDLCTWFRPHYLSVESDTNDSTKALVIQKLRKAMTPDKWPKLRFYIPPNTSSKQARIRNMLTSALNGRRFRFKKGSPGISLLIQQLLGFPTATYDDAPDSLAQAMDVYYALRQGRMRQKSGGFFQVQL